MIESRLTLIGEICREGRRYMGLYRCVCGAEKIIDSHKVKSGHTKSCGCLQKEVIRQRQTLHGRCYEPEYRVWSNMIKRCSDARYKKWYGHVSIHPEWLVSYDQFLADVGRKPFPNATLDRISFEGNYDPSNVRWTTREIQSRNTKNHATNKTGIRGVSWSNTKQKWRSAIYVKNHQKHLGYFDDIEQAAAARKLAEKHLWKELK